MRIILEFNVDRNLSFENEHFDTESVWGVRNAMQRDAHTNRIQNIIIQMHFQTHMPRLFSIALTV